MRIEHRAILLTFLASLCLASCRMPDDANLVFIGGAISDYGRMHRTYPANICDKQGKPLLSWRVAVLPHGSGEEGELYKKFRLDEPWNSPHNLKVAREVPEMYRDPNGSEFTPYLGVTGENAAFRSGRPRSYDPKGEINAVVVVVDKSDVLWSEPRDISIEEVKKGDRLRLEKRDGRPTLYVLSQLARRLRHLGRHMGKSCEVRV